MIFLIRGEKVMLDRDLAKLYGVSTGRLNEQVKRNRRRFPKDFMFQLTFIEMKNWISHIAISNREKMGLRRRPYAFTENGVAMLSSVLNSERAIQVNIRIMRIFTKVRKLVSSNQKLLNRLKKIERHAAEHDQHILKIFNMINQILNLPITLKRKSKPIGFLPPK